MPQRFVATASKGMHAIFQFEMNGDIWRVAVDDGKMDIHQGVHHTPDVTLKMDASDYVNMVNGKLSGATAIMNSQLKIIGSMTLAQKMRNCGVYDMGTFF